MRTKIFLAIVAIVSACVVALGLYWNRQKHDLSSQSTRTEVSLRKVEDSSKEPEMRGNIDVNFTGSHTPDYYTDLPELQKVIKDFESLTDEEIDKKITEVEDVLKSEDIVNRANGKNLDDKGFRHLAQLLQRSDALYQIKISRQLDDVEAAFTQVR